MESRDMSRARLGNDKIGPFREKIERRQSTKFPDLAILRYHNDLKAYFNASYVYRHTPLDSGCWVLCEGESNFLRAVEAIDTDTNISTAKILGQ